MRVGCDAAGWDGKQVCVDALCLSVRDFEEHGYMGQRTSWNSVTGIVEVAGWDMVCDEDSGGER